MTSKSVKQIKPSRLEPKLTRIEGVKKIQAIIKKGCATGRPYPWCSKDEDCSPKACWYHEAEKIYNQLFPQLLPIKELDLMGIFNDCFPYIGAKDRRNEAAYKVVELINSRINSQVLPQPLDNEKARERIVATLEAWQDTGTDYVTSYSFNGIAYEILPLLPQPLDNKELREKIKDWWVNKDKTWCIYQRCQDYEDGCGYCIADQILALPQPKIEEAKREERERIGEVLYQIIVKSSEETDLTLEGEKRKLVFICNKLRPLINELKCQALKGGE